MLLVHTDGLTDRRTPDGVSAAELPALLRPPLPRDVAALADAVLAAVERAGPATDDATLLAVRVAG